MDRRDLLKTAALAGIPAGVAACATSPTMNTATRGAELPAGPSPAEILRKAPPVDLERAYAVMERDGLSGLVLMNPVNVYHFTGFWPATSRMGFRPGAYALVSRDRQQPVAVVAAEFTYYYLLSDNAYEYPFQVFLFTGPADREQLAAARAGRYQVDAPAAPAGSTIFKDAGREPLLDTERARLAAAQAAAARQGVSADAEFALLKAIRALGLDRGKVGVDEAELSPLFASAGLATQVVPGDDTLKRIRMVKSARELQLMRLAATANMQAALAAAQAARAGASYRELRSTFFAEAARRGNRGVFMVIGGVSAEGVDRPLREGDAFLFDAVSEGAGYHGDFARTVFVGEPRPTMKKAAAAITLGWATVRDALRPGLRLSEITALGRDTLRKAGFDFNVAFGPHSVGLFHTDASGLGDLALEPGMILSVDCPVMQAGIGGTAHLEDLTLITQTGSERIHPGAETIVQV
jgi:Xaa-Pro aminopeptidase